MKGLTQVVIFLSVAVGMIARMSLHRVNDVVSLMMIMFDLVWVIGWSVGVILLGQARGYRRKE